MTSSRWLSSYKTGLFSSGYNEFYQLFLHDNINRNVLTFSNTIPLQKDERIKQISSGEKHSFLLTSKGKLYGIGMNEFGQVGVGNVSSFLQNLNPQMDKKMYQQHMEKIEMSTHIDIDHVLNPIINNNNNFNNNNNNNIKNENTKYGNKELEIQIKELEKELNYKDFITNVVCGRDFTFISTDKELPEKVASIACGAFHTIILTRDHHIYIMGLNIFGQLGIDPKVMEQRVKNEVYINPKGELIDFSYISKPIRLDYFDYMAYEGDFISHISTGACHSAFLSNSGKLFMCGFNINGEIGMGQSIRYSFTPKKPIFRYPYPYMDESPTIRAISCGLDHTIVVTENGEVFSTGKNEDGQLGLGDVKNRYEFNMVEYFENETLNSKIIDVECGMCHSIFIGTQSKNSNNSKQEFYMSGCNKYGNLGLGDFENRKLPTKLTSVAKSKNGILWKIIVLQAHNSLWPVFPDANLQKKNQFQKSQLSKTQRECKDNPTFVY
ncbi:predicted protein [Naegleria gruberi]|uniref:Predicted protein n=1 Tax=Naegleria gruberi TaxID=5762 RepID=D2W597_NAEGR|nr:uncharacterized protein NAEGRDRAFT_76585 [Naegleria gruberi]EFC35755.1 predicted protein [Naegleria gruberi]|eukprot:XP_002668499.1 predicted protein [Naegleria gruberi strain NEG-M]